MLDVFKHYNPVSKQNRGSALIALVLFVLINVSALVFIRSFVRNQHFKLKTQTVEHLSQRRAYLESWLNQVLYIPNALGAYATVNNGVDYAFFEQLSIEMTHKIPVFKNISLAPDNIIKYVYPIEGNEEVIGFNYLQHSTQSLDVKRAIEKKSTIITGPVELIQGGRAFIVRAPVFTSKSFSADSGKYWGMVSMVIDFDLLIGEFDKQLKDIDFSFSLRGLNPYGQKQVFYGDSLMFRDNPLTLDVLMAGEDSWEIAALPRNGWDLRQHISSLIILLTILSALVTSIMLYVIVVNFRRLSIMYSEKLELIRKLREINLTQHKLYRVIAHDIRAPFNALVNITTMLEVDYDNNSRISFYNRLKYLNKQAYDLNDLLENLFSWTKSQLEGVNFKPTKNNLKEIVEEIFILVEIQSQVKKISVEFDAISDVYVVCDRNMISTVLRNLLSNAIKFTPQGGQVRVAFEENKGEVVVKVIDNGVGMSKDVLMQLKEQGSYYSSFGTEKEPGTGLGLSISKEFIQAHDSTIEIESEVGVGSVFSFSLPILT